jgi:hypothetical protein
MIPSMGGAALAPWFTQWARESNTVVELGTWLGAGTNHLAATCPGTVYTYDEFVIRGNEVEKAAAYDVTVTRGQDSLPLVQSMLSHHRNIVFTKGRIEDVQWQGGEIDLYVDDACKYGPEFLAALKIFSPYWIPGKTVVAFMDYWFYLARLKDPALKFQKDFITSHRESFSFIMTDKKLGIAAFRYLGGLKI